LERWPGAPGGRNGARRARPAAAGRPPKRQVTPPGGGSAGMNLALVIDHDIGRLDVAVNDPLAVRIMERIGQVANEQGGAAGVDWRSLFIRLLDQNCNGPTRDIRRGEVGLWAVDTGLIDRHDVRMAELSRGLGLTRETLDGLGRRQGTGVQDLQRHLAAER